MTIRKALRLHDQARKSISEGKGVSPKMYKRLKKAIKRVTPYGEKPVYKR